MGSSVAIALLWACQSPPYLVDEQGIRHRAQGWSVAAPPSAGAEGGWEQVRIPESLVAYRRLAPAGPGWMTLSSRCGVSLAPPRVLARHLLIGTARHTEREAARVHSAGLEGWAQTVDAREDGALVRLKTVTFVVGRCALDWVLSVPGGRGFEAAERDFDAWWQSLRRDAAAGEEEVS